MSSATQPFIQFHPKLSVRVDAITSIEHDGEKVILCYSGQQRVLECESAGEAEQVVMWVRSILAGKQASIGEEFLLRPVPNLQAGAPSEEEKAVSQKIGLLPVQKRCDLMALAHSVSATSGGQTGVVQVFRELVDAIVADTELVNKSIS